VLASAEAPCTSSGPRGVCLPTLLRVTIIVAQEEIEFERTQLRLRRERCSEGSQPRHWSLEPPRPSCC
jgi:hypothetical protein